MKTKKLLAEPDDRADKTCEKDELSKFHLNDDYRYFSRSSIGILIQDKYCKCGRIRNSYDDKLSTYGTKCAYYGVDKMPGDVFELDKGAIYLTKKSLMLNQFLEYNDTRTASSIHTNDSTNRFGLNTVSNGNKCRMKSPHFDVVQVPENRKTLCVQSSMFSDKRLVSLFRSVALYWFFCLNTVLAKSEVFKRKTLDLPKNDTANLELSICPDVLENLCDLNNDFLRKVIFQGDVEDTGNVSSLLSYAEHSREKLFDDLFKKVLLDLAGTSGIFDSMNANRTAVERSSAGGRTPTSPGKNASPRNTRRKYDFDVLDFDLVGTFCNNVVWKKRAVKNKWKSKRKGGNRNERMQQLIIHSNAVYVDDDLEEVMTIYEEPDSSEELEYCVPEEKAKVVDTEEKPECQDQPVTTSAQSLEMEDAYFLPDGMLNVEEKVYPKYNLWSSPLIAEKVLPPRKPFAKMSPPKPPKQAFKPYRLWESSFGAEDDYIPNFRGNEFSVFSMPQQNTRPRPKPPSSYSLWGSPNIIDFLPGTGFRFQDSSASSSSSESLDYDALESFEVLKTKRRDNNFVRGKFLNFKPVINGFVSFTDRGAFKYYKKPEIEEPEYETLDEADLEVKSIVGTTPKNEFDAVFYFKPIQPAIKVETDMPACFERSESGTLFYNNRKLMTFKHELDSQRNPADLFQPKFIVSSNDVACQTDDYGCPSRMSFSRCDQPLAQFYNNTNEDAVGQEQYVAGAAFFYSLEEVFNFLGKPGLGNIGELDPMTLNDVKAQVDFSCMF